MSVIRDILEHIKKAIEAPSSETVTKFPSIASASFRLADGGGGARLELAAAVGQSRVFDFSLEDSSTTPLFFGGEAPMAYVEEMPVRIRYESSGPSRKLDQLDQIKIDQIAVIDSIHRSRWADVEKLATLTARPGTISSFTLLDDSGSGHEYAGFISEINVSISYDV